MEEISLINNDNAARRVTCLSTKQPFFCFSYIVNLFKELEFASWSNLIPNRPICLSECIHSYSMAWAQLTDYVDKESNTLCAVRFT